MVTLVEMNAVTIPPYSADTMDQFSLLKSRVKAPFTSLLLTADNSSPNDSRPVCSIEEQRRNSKVKKVGGISTLVYGSLSTPFSHANPDSLDSLTEFGRIVKHRVPESIDGSAQVVDMNFGRVLCKQNSDGNGCAASVRFYVVNVMKVILFKETYHSRRQSALPPWIP